MDATTRFDTPIVGSLPVITQCLERLKVADHVDQLVPWESEVHMVPSKRGSLRRDNFLTTCFTTVHTDPADLCKLLEAARLRRYLV
jgi:hypothetical protein